MTYLHGYPAALVAQAEALAARRQLLAAVLQRHPQRHDVRTDRALYAYVGALKARFMCNAEPLAKVAYDSRLQLRRNALGTHTAVSRVQGGRLKAKREIRIASLFKDAPADFLKMIVVHELAHLKQREHDKDFHALCLHMEPDYHRIELDVRLWLTALELERGNAQAAGAAPGAKANATPFMQ